MNRPDDHNLLKKTKSNVENRYQELSNEREIKKPTQMPQFEDDEPKNYENTSNLYDKIMDMRKNDDKIVSFNDDDKSAPCFIPYEVGDSGTLIDNIDGKVDTNDHCNPFNNDSREKEVIEKKKVDIDTVVPKNMKDDYSLVNDRNEEEIFIKNQFCDNDPKDLYKDVLSKSKIDTMDPTPRTTEIDYLNKPDLTNKNLVNHEVIINASDRNWFGYWESNGNNTYKLIRSGNYNRYSFDVKFSPGDISSQLDGQNSLNILRTFNNIQAIVLQSMNMAYFDNTSQYKSNNEYLNADFRVEPYLLLSIDELNNNTQTTSKNRFPYFSKLNLNTCITVRDKNIRGFANLMPPMQAKRDFYNNPLQQLDKMSFNILKSDGNLYGNENTYNIDNILVTSITFENSDNGTTWLNTTGKTDFIVLNVEPYINLSQYKISDRIIIKNFKCCQTITNTNAISFDTSKNFHKSLEDFINLDEGHNIIKLGPEGDIPDFTNKIYISVNYNMNINNGTYTNSLYNEYVSDNYNVGGSSIPSMGEILNQSIQPSITLDIKTIDFFIPKN